MPLRVEDKTLPLKAKRTLGYADNGNTSSNVVILFLHGAFSIGDASRPPKCLLERHYHFVAPSLPGWGKSSPVPSPRSFTETFIEDITALILHLHPKTSNLRLFICGHGFGTVAAEILHAASYQAFPLGRSIKGLMLLSPYSPPHCHADYSRTLSWKDYFMTGPPAKICPFTSFVFSFSISHKLESPDWLQEHVAKMLRTPTQFDTYLKWQEVYEVEDGRLHAETAANITRSVAQTWRGFTDMSAIYHSGWGGVKPNQLDEAHSHTPVLIVSCKDDAQVPLTSAQWLKKTYERSTLVVLEGGHMAAFLQLDQLWMDLFAMLEEE